MNYLPKFANIEQACEWLRVRTGSEWILPRLLECHLKPYFWIDYAPGYPQIFGDCREGYLSWMVFQGDVRRLEIDGTNALVNMFTAHDGTLVKSEPGWIVPLSELRFKREAIERVASILEGEALRQETAPSGAPESDEPPITIADHEPGALAINGNEENDIAALFDPVRPAQLEAMFPDGGKWKTHSERALRNGLKEAAKQGRASYNPYLAAIWWLNTGPQGWKWERCLRVLANNLPARSIDSRHLLTGEYE